jgi:4'-phosphopantetheinyl transferase
LIELTDGRELDPGRVAAGVRRRGAAIVVAHEASMLAERLAADGTAILGAEHARYLGLPSAEARARLLVSRWLLKTCVSRLAGVPVRDVALGAGAWGRPMLLSPAGVDVSVSHSGSAVAIGLSAGARIGVDIEPADRDLAPIARMLCTPTELARLATVAAHRRGEHLVRLWTLKEAHGKAVGTGLGIGMTTLALRLRTAGATPMTGTGSWRYRSWRAGALWASIAVCPIDSRR